VHVVLYIPFNQSLGIQIASVKHHFIDLDRLAELHWNPKKQKTLLLTKRPSYINMSRYKKIDEKKLCCWWTNSILPRKIGVNFYFILKESYEKIVVFEVNTCLKDPSAHK
jgi:hypothetical protein